MNWTVDYGEGPRPCAVPHAWRQDVPVAWEGPAVYRCALPVSFEDEWLVFEGVSYEARVFIDGALVCEHRGIWDAFAVSLSAYVGREVPVEVHVVKNGGATFPVRDVLSGFLPYVYHTFGGIYGGVRVVRSTGDPSDPAELEKSNHRVQVNYGNISVDSAPFYLRGVLSWGWYPELGHTNPPDDEIRREVRLARQMGFNTIKFCLWVPRHRFFEILGEEGMNAWLELPLWDPTGDEAKLEAMAQEIRRIVRQYRHHRSIIAWTVGCELSANTPHEYRKRLVEMVQKETGCPLVKDNSGGAEMYGGDLREYGTFEDFHPYCETHWYPPVLDSLRNGPRSAGPILLGEFNDYDVHRDLQELAGRSPYWLSDDPALNDQGVRWQHDMPRILRESRWVERDNSALVRSSVSKGAWIRRRVMEHVRAMHDVGGYVVTGWRHTPISTSGMVDDDLQPVFDNFAEWNGDSMLFLIPVRRPPWVDGGNRPGWLDPLCFFEGQAFFRIGCHMATSVEAQLKCTIGETSIRCEATDLFCMIPGECGRASFSLAKGEYELVAEFGDIRARWPVWVVPRPDWSAMAGWSKHDPGHAFDDVAMPGGDNLLTTRLDVQALDHAKAHRVLAVLEHEGTVSMPFWRECAQEFAPGLLDPWADQWDRHWGFAPDRALDPDWLHQTVGDYEVLLNRVDTRTYKEHPYVVRRDNLIVTTLRPQGGHGAQPYGVKNNPSGATLLATLLNEW
jgi:hypothetical protein